MARAVTCSCSRRSSSRASVCTSSFGGNGTTSANSDASRRAERMSCRVRKSRSAHGRPADCQHIRLRGRGPVAQTWFLVAERLPGRFSKQNPAATALQNARRDTGRLLTAAAHRPAGVVPAHRYAVLQCPVVALQRAGRDSQLNLPHARSLQVVPRVRPRGPRPP